MWNYQIDTDMAILNTTQQTGSNIDIILRKTVIKIHIRNHTVIDMQNANALELVVQIQLTVVDT